MTDSPSSLQRKVLQAPVASSGHRGARRRRELSLHSNCEYHVVSAWISAEMAVQAPNLLWYKHRNPMRRPAPLACLLVVLCQVAAVWCGIGRMDSSLLFNPNPAAYGTTFGPHVKVATSVTDARLTPSSVTVQAWIMPLPRDNGQNFTGPNDLGQVVGNMARSFSPSRIFAGYSLYCRDSISGQLFCSFFVATSTSAFLEPSCVVPAQRWSHVCGAYDESTGLADIYVDGSKCATSSSAGGAAPISYFLRSSFLVGAWIEDATGRDAARLLQPCILAFNDAVSSSQVPRGRSFISPGGSTKCECGPACERRPKSYPTCSTQSRPQSLYPPHPSGFIFPATTSQTPLLSPTPPAVSSPRCSPRALPAAFLHSIPSTSMSAALCRATSSTAPLIDQHARVWFLGSSG